MCCSLSNFLFFVITQKNLDFVVCNLYILYPDRGIIRLSLGAQFIVQQCIVHCNGLEGIYLENESKIWLNNSVLLNSVGAGIHIGTGSKCLLTKSKINNCGEGDYQLLSRQGAIVMYADEINYARHLVL